ncbi:MAG: adenylate cyclase [Deltaproteobacteria bacterium]|nr:adenylate cyclase [Deltaproteobacteria bacterium]
MLSFKRIKLVYGAVIALTTALTVNLVFFYGLFEELELKTVDIRAKNFSKYRHVPEDIAIILIDEASLRSMNPVVGRWPWPRSLHADLIEFLNMGGARAVLFDILFTENELIPGEPRGKVGSNDKRLVEATGAAGNVYHAAQLLVDVEDEYNKGLLNKPLPPDFIERFSIKGLAGVVAGQNNTYYLPFPQLYKASAGVGIVEFSPDNDGIFRRTRLFRHYQGSFFPVLPMVSLLDVLQPSNIRVDRDNLILEDLQGTGPEGQPEGAARAPRVPSSISIPLMKDGSYFINMYGGFNPYSMSGILASIQKIKMGEIEGLPVNPEEFRDKVVFIGASATGVEDLKPTSLGNNTPGVYLHASLYSNMIRKDFLKFTSPLITAVFVVLLSFIVAIAILWTNRIRYQIGLPILLAFAYISASSWWFKSNIAYDLVAPLTAIILSWMGTYAYLSLTEIKDKRKIKKMLRLATVMDKSPEGALKAGVGSKENLTILFSDIRGFTTLSESLEAEKVVEILNSYLSGIVDVIFKHEGTLDKFIGDAIMAFWGAPVKVSDHSKRAVDAAIEMMRWLDTFNEVNMSKGFPRIAIGVGINTGDVILGNIGSEKKLDYTVIGDNVNLASRMEGLTKEYGCPILITETTYEEVRDAILCRVVDIVRVKGKKKGIRIFEPLGKKEGLNESIYKLQSLSKEGFDYYLNREWEKAREKYKAIQLYKPDDALAGIFIMRCEDYMAVEPSKDWDGVYTMLKK